MGALKSHHVAGVLHHQDDLLVPAGGKADAAEGFLGQVVAFHARMKLGAGLNEGLGEKFGVFNRPFEQMECQALGGTGPHPGKLSQFVKQFFKGGRIFGHGHLISYEF
jgi:hypothetical protein